MRWLTTKRISTFTNIAYEGNPAWVIIGVDEKEDEKTLIKLARELNPLSDTVFVFTKTQDADLLLRFFSYSEEINFSGHGTIATYFAIEKENLIKFTEPITLIKQKTKAGIQHIELRLKNNSIERVTVSLPVPQFISTPVDIKQVTRFLNMPPVDMLDSTYPLDVITLSGNTDIIVPVKNCEILMNIAPNFQVMKNFCDRMQLTGVVVWCLDTMENTVHMRHFAPSVGIDEDPVSGAASASLGCYLVHNQFVPLQEMTRIIVNQGHAMGRPGKVYIHVHGYKNEIMKVSFGGQGVVTFEGHIAIPGNY